MKPYDITLYHMLVGESTDPEILKYAEMVLEADNMPVRDKLGSSLFNSVLEKSDIDFGTIPNSKGNLKDWDHYTTMVETVHVIRNVVDKKNPVLLAKLDVIEDAINNICTLAPNYSKGFTYHSNYVITEYCVMVLTCVNAVSSIIYDYGDYIRSLNDGSFEIRFSNKENKNSRFYFVHLEKFNKMVQNSGMEYRKMLDSISNGDRNNFTGVEILGMATVAAIVFAVIPVTRELIYHFYKFKNSLADSLEVQAFFLEMNRACVESNANLNPTKKKTVIAKQEKLSKMLRGLSEKLRVKSVKASRESEKDLARDNKSFTIDEIKKDISNSPIELL